VLVGRRPEPAVEQFVRLSPSANLDQTRELAAGEPFVERVRAQVLELRSCRSSP
jgi:hypothetical protein